jgi:hypothetical protein
VTAGGDELGHCGCGDGRAQSRPFLLLVDLLDEDLCRDWRVRFTTAFGLRDLCGPRAVLQTGDVRCAAA